MPTPEHLLLLHQQDARDDEDSPAPFLGPAPASTAVTLCPGYFHGPPSPPVQTTLFLAPGETRAFSAHELWRRVEIRVRPGVDLYGWLNRAAADVTPGEDAEFRVTAERPRVIESIEVSTLVLYNAGTDNAVLSGVGQNVALAAWTTRRTLP